MKRLKLPHGETDPRKTYSFPDTDALSEAYAEAYDRHFHQKKSLTNSQVRVLLSLAQGYLALTTYVLGQECCVKKLRDIWRARRARMKEER